MMWTVCSRFFTKDTGKNKLFAIFVSIGIFFLSLFPFGKLVGVFYPLVGYVGLLFIGCVIYKGTKTFMGIRASKEMATAGHHGHVSEPLDQKR